LSAIANFELEAMDLMDTGSIDALAQNIPRIRKARSFPDQQY